MPHHPLFYFQTISALQLNYVNIRLHRLISTACRWWRVTAVFTLWRWCWCWTAVSIEAGRFRSLLTVDHASSLQCVLAVLLSWSAAVSWLMIVFVCHQCRWLHRSRLFQFWQLPVLSLCHFLWVLRDDIRCAHSSAQYLRTMFPIRLGSALQIRGSRLTTLLVYQYTRFMNRQKTPLRLSKITPRFHGTRIGMTRIHLCKKVNLVKNVTYEVLSRRRRFEIWTHTVILLIAKFWMLSELKHVYWKIVHVECHLNLFMLTTVALWLWTWSTFTCRVVRASSLHERRSLLVIM